MAKTHTFHIPVMGIGFTLETPFKVSKYGIDSVISIVDDILLEKLRKVYCDKFELPYKEITNKIDDFRAKRITSYLDLINDLAEKKYSDFINSASGIKEYVSLLPDTSSIKEEFKTIADKLPNVSDVSSWVKENLSMGSIDVNIMTKIDKDNYKDGEKLPLEYNDAHAALRGFANSKLKSSIVLSAGMHPRLYGYIENFEDFYPNENGEIKKKIVLKVSDYRSALIQGRFFAKKGLWVSEYRIESGLNCGGHAFATEGMLMGPILAEFKEHREQLRHLANETISQALKDKGRTLPATELEFKITAQGGVGTTEEHEFLMDYYGMDHVGWGSPFLLVPEATTIDKTTFNLLKESKEEDLYLSGISPLGVPFNSLKGNTKDIEKYKLAEEGKPGSVCPKRYLVSNNDYTEKNICTASRQFQRIKIKELGEEIMSVTKYNKEYEKIIEKSCICVGLGAGTLIENGIDTKLEGDGVSVCPGPNIAYYENEMSLKQMVDHIYGRANVINRTDRPNMFVKEIQLYIDYITNLIEDSKEVMNAKQEKYLKSFVNNLTEGVEYYNSLFTDVKDKFEDVKSNILSELDNSKKTLINLYSEIEKISLSMA